MFHSRSLQAGTIPSTHQTPTHPSIKASIAPSTYLMETHLSQKATMTTSTFPTLLQLYRMSPKFSAMPLPSLVQVWMLQLSQLMQLWMLIWTSLFLAPFQLDTKKQVWLTSCHTLLAAHQTLTTMLLSQLLHVTWQAYVTIQDSSPLDKRQLTGYKAIA